MFGLASFARFRRFPLVTRPSCVSKHQRNAFNFRQLPRYIGGVQWLGLRRSLPNGIPSMTVSTNRLKAAKSLGAVTSRWNSFSSTQAGFKRSSQHVLIGVSVAVR